MVAAGAVHPRQPEQRYRPAADPAGPERRASCRRDRDGHEPSGRDRLPGTDLARPTVALVNNAQRAHLEGMGDLDEVAREKGAIFSGLPADGVAVINADDAYAELLERHGRRASGTYLRPSTVRPMWWQVVRQHGLEIAIDLSAPEGEVQIAPAVCPVATTRGNAVAAAAACLAAGVPLAAVAAGLAGFRRTSRAACSVAQRQGWRRRSSTTPTTPIRIRCAPASTCWPRPSGRKLLVLGDMGEIGEAERPVSRRDRRLCQEPRHRSACSRWARPPRPRCATSATAPATSAMSSKLIAAVDKELGPDTTVLVKGSRFMKMERVADALAAAPSEEKH